MFHLHKDLIWRVALKMNELLVPAMGPCPLPGYNKSLRTEICNQAGKGRYCSP